jgi:hypothetical protein
MAIFAGDTVRVQLRGRCFGQRIICTWGYRVSVGNGEITTRNALIAINGVIGGAGAATPLTTYLACLPAQYVFDEVRSQVVSPVKSAFQDFTFEPPQAGTHAGAATVSCDSAAVVRRTVLAGRNQVSTLKVGPCPDNASAAGLLTPAYAALIAAFGSATITGFVVGVTQIALIPTLLTPLGAANGRDLESIHVGLTSRVMRRRVVGIGE